MKRKVAIFVVAGFILAVGFSSQFFNKFQDGDSAEGAWEAMICRGSNTAAQYAMAEENGISWTDGLTKLVVNGFVDSRSEDESVVMTDFTIVNQETKQVLFVTDSLVYFRVTAVEDGLVLTRLEYLPIGHGWGWEHVEVSKQLLSVNGEEISISSAEPLLADVTIPSHQIREFDHRVKALIESRDKDQDWQEVMKQALVCALANDSYSRDILINFEERFSIRLSDSDRQSLADCLLVLHGADNMENVAQAALTL